MDAAFKLAANKSRRVLKLRLEPLTLGHIFLLHEVESSFVLDGPAMLEDLALSAFICASPWRKSQANLKKWWAPRFMLFWGRICKGLNFSEEREAFANYLKDSSKPPNFNRTKQSEAIIPDGCPLHWATLVFLMRELHMSHDEALDCEMSRAVAYSVVTGSLRGSLMIWSDIQHAHWEHAKRMDELATEGKN